mmetsp:Transcript_154956/g.496613  ORF Transcript_154956/g.496613 Transcript_154956/m.496613 type:complete len:421 (-) Transcript_154956:8-1270(-)
MPNLAGGSLVPHLEEKLLVVRGLHGGHFHLQHVDHTHQQGNAVVTTPPLELRLRRLQLAPKFVHAFPGDAAAAQRWPRAPPTLQVNVELAQPSLQLIGRGEGSLGLSLLHLAAVEEVALDHAPLEPDPSMDVLELSLAILVGMFELQGVEVHGREPLTYDVHCVEVIHCHQTRIALGCLDFHSVVHELLGDDPQRALVARVVLGRGPVRIDPCHGLDHSLHLLFCDRSRADVVQVRHQGHFRQSQLLGQQTVPDPLATITILLPRVEQEDPARVGIRRCHLGTKHVRDAYDHGLVAFFGLPHLQACFAPLDFVEELAHRLCVALAPILGADTPCLQHISERLHSRHIGQLEGPLNSGSSKGLWKNQPRDVIATHHGPASAAVLPRPHACPPMQLRKVLLRRSPTRRLSKRRREDRGRAAH